MGRLFSRFFLWVLGWKVKPEMPKEVQERCVMICAPHTSNWDYPLAMWVMSALRVNFKYTIKQEWLKPPFGFLFRWMGGIGINRKPKKEGEERPSMVQAMAELFEKNDKLCLMVPAEGSRSLRKEWKTGFYYVALTASVPIVLGYLDYQKKEAGIGMKVIYPSGDIAKDMFEICEFYKNIPAKFPEKFSVDERYHPAKTNDQTPNTPPSDTPTAG